MPQTPPTIEAPAFASSLPVATASKPTWKEKCRKGPLPAIPDRGAGTKSQIVTTRFNAACFIQVVSPERPEIAIHDAGSVIPGSSLKSPLTAPNHLRGPGGGPSKRGTREAPWCGVAPAVASGSLSVRIELEILAGSARSSTRYRRHPFETWCLLGCSRSPVPSGCHGVAQKRR